MRTSFAAFAALLLLLLVATRAHGIRLDRQLHEAINSKMRDSNSLHAEASVADSVMKKHCTPDGRCSAAKVKKALAHADETAEEATQQQHGSAGNGHTTTVDADAVQQEGRRQAEAASHGVQHASVAAAASRRVPRQRQRIFPDLMDIAGMDYSPASRKPPIHN